MGDYFGKTNGRDCNENNIDALISICVNLPSCLCVTDNEGHVIDLVKDKLPEMQLSDEDRQKNRELLEEAKKVSDRFLTRRGRRSRCSLTESPTGNDHTLYIPILNCKVS